MSDSGVPIERIADLVGHAGGSRVTEQVYRHQMAAIGQNLDAVSEASERVGRKDWVPMVQGAAFSLIVNAAVPQHVVQMLLMTARGLAHLFGLPGMPPTLPPHA
jgi:hypothetical protein